VAHIRYRARSGVWHTGKQGVVCGTQVELGVGCDTQVELGVGCGTQTERGSYT
jgi:hypothetical protein